MRLAGRIILVTGASRGLGAAVAEACAREGARLILLARTRGGLEETDDRIRAAGGEAAMLIPLDLREGELVDRLGPALFERHGRLDGLVSCAAELGSLSPVGHLEPAELARIMQVNALAVQRLIASVEPLLKASDAGRAVFVTDAAAHEQRAYWGGYAASKAALEALVLAWAKELRITTVRASLVDPGPMATRLRRLAFPGEARDTQPDPATIAPQLLSLLEPACDLNAELIRLR